MSCNESLDNYILYFIYSFIISVYNYFIMSLLYFEHRQFNHTSKLIAVILGQSREGKRGGGEWMGQILELKVDPQTRSPFERF